MSFGYSVGDVVMVSQLAWKAYKACKQAPESFAAVSQEALSLNAVLRELEESLNGLSLPPAQQERLKVVCEGCQTVLNEILALVEKYASLATSSQRTWDRMRYGAEDIAELRSRLISSTTLLTAFVANTQFAVEQKLRKLIKEIQNGTREPSIVSVRTIDSLAADERGAWRDIRKALQDIGVTPAAFEQNKDFILNFLRDLMVSGELEELAVIPTPAPESTALESTTQDYLSRNTQITDAEMQQRQYQDKIEDAMAGYHDNLRHYFPKDLRENPKVSRITPEQLEKLARLSHAQFKELSQDVSDELRRRKSKESNTATADFLPPNTAFHPKRNRARQRMSTLPPHRFQALGIDVVDELERRFPRFAMVRVEDPIVERPPSPPQSPPLLPPESPTLELKGDLDITE